jgi:hypothetical protein
LSGTDIILTQNDSSTITVDMSGMSAGTGGVALTGDQAITGSKSFAEIKFDGPHTDVVEVIASSATPLCDTTAAHSHYLDVTSNGLLNFTWPTGASDAQLGAYWCKRGVILMKWSGSYTMGFNAAMLAALDDYEIEGTHVTASGELCSLAYTYWYLNGTEYAQFAWVATA